MIGNDAAGRTDRDELSRRLQTVRARVVRALDARLGRRLRPLVDVEDLWQETCLNAIESGDSLSWRGEGPFLRWVMTIGSRMVSRAARRLLGEGAQCRPEVSSLEDLSMALIRASTGPSTRAQRHEEAARVVHVFATLPPAQRNVLVLDYICLMTHEEIAETLNSNVEAVRKTHYRAIRALRAALAAQNRPEGSES